MDRERIEELSVWVTEAGLAGASETDLLTGFCERARAVGLRIATGLAIIDTLHPVHEGRAFRWSHHDAGESAVVEYGRTNQGGQDSERWRMSPMYHLVQSGEAVLRRCFATGAPCDFPVLEDMRAAGHTDFLAVLHRFGPAGIIGELDCIYLSWGGDAPEGFGEEEAAILCRLAPTLCLALKSVSLARIAETLVETYLGRDAGRRVLSGRIERGVADRIEAALWFSDLRGYTSITGAARPDEIIPFLNDYAEAIISSVEEAGGDVLKLIGDGTLAIFNGETRAEACRAALVAEAAARVRIAAVNERRTAQGLAVTEAYIGLHVGEVFYGNVGSQTRLDFTVVGPAVNEASRIAALCRSVERDVLASAAFADATDAPDRDRLVSVGRYALRGVERPQELFTLMPREEG